MKLIFLLLFTITACQDFNSNSSDKQLYGPRELPVGDADFSAALTVLNNRCLSCHTHQSWASLNTTDKWAQQGLIIKGSPSSSILIQKIRNYGGTNSNMPPTGGDLPPAEYTALLTWIQNAP